MNKSSFFGFIIVAIIQYLVVYHTAKSPAIFLDLNAFILVFGGTVAAALIAFPFSSLTRTVDFLIWGLILKKKDQNLKVSQDIAGARNAFLVNQNYLTNDESHPFLRESVLFLLNKNIDNKAFEEILRKRSEYFRKRYIDDAKVLQSLGKYPTAFGFLGVAIKVIEALQTSSLNGYKNLGESIAVAFVALFWGLGLSNFIILPLADSALKSAEEDQQIRNLIVDGMILIRKKVTDDHFQAYLRGYLHLSDRSEFKIYSGKNVIPLPIPPKIEAQNTAAVETSVSDVPNDIQIRAETSVTGEDDPSEAITRVTSEVDLNSVNDSDSSTSVTQIGEEKTKRRVRRKSVMENPGRIEGPIEINQNAKADETQFNFKDLRNELKKPKVK